MMTQNADKIIEKIKKLLELATSPNEHEAKRAMEMAQKLMIQYNLSFTDLDSGTGPEKIEQTEYFNENFNRLGVREQLPRIVKTIGRIFGCFALYGRKGTGVISQVLLYGYSTNLKIAEYALDSIFAQGALDLKVAMKKSRSAMIGLEFWDGFAYGLQRKFEQFSSVEQNGALTVYDPVKNFVNSISGGTFKLSSYSGSGREAGIESGMKAEIRPGLDSKSGGKLLN